MIQTTRLGAARTFVLILLLAVVWFGPLGYRALIKSDEGRDAEIAREMHVSGDWVTPRLNDLKYFYKPPLQYWATAAAYRTVGENEFAARLWSALTSFLTVLLAGFTAAIAQALLRGIDTRCGCLGGEEMAGWGTVARDVALLAMSLLIVMRGPGRLSGER